MADAARRREDDPSYSPPPRPRRVEKANAAYAGLAAFSIFTAALVYVRSPAPVAVEPFSPPEAAIAPARETVPVAAPAEATPASPPEKAVAAPATENSSEAVFTHYTTEPGFVTRAVVRIDGKVVLSRKLFRGKSEGGADIRAMPPTNCASSFLQRAGGKPIYKDAVTATLPAARRYSLEVRWYDADGDEFSRDVFDVDGKKAISRHTAFRTSNVPMLTQQRIGDASIENGGMSAPNANSMAGGWNVPKRPSWQPELPSQASFFGP